MYNGRRSAHDDLMDFVARIDGSQGRIGSLLDVGCGLAVGYADGFTDRRYVGVDLSEKEIRWCREHRSRANHDYIHGDIITDPPEEKFDLVFSQGTIDNSYDMDAYLRAIARCARRWIYVTAYRGWFPDLPEHRYSWDEGTTCFYNDISPRQTRETLEALGCTDIRIGPLSMTNAAVPFETCITARIPSDT
jgi:SAM-dependent methyltransferase